MTRPVLLLAVYLAVTPSGSAAPARTDKLELETKSHGGIIKVKENVQVSKDDVVEGAVVSFGGDVRVEGSVEEDVVVFGGKATVLGRVDGSVVVFGDEAELGPQAEVGGDFVTFGSTVRRQPGSRVEGQTVTLHGLGLAAALAGLGGVLALAAFWFKLISVFGWLLLGAVAGWLLHRSLKESAELARRRPGAGFLLGLLLFPATALLSAALFVSILGIPLVPVAVFAAGLAYVWGYLTVGQWLGEWVTRGAAKAPWVVCFSGVALLQALSFIPVLGKVAGALATLVGAGAGIMWLSKRATER